MINKLIGVVACTEIQLWSVEFSVNYLAPPPSKWRKSPIAQDVSLQNSRRIYPSKTTTIKPGVKAIDCFLVEANTQTQCVNLENLINLAAGLFTVTCHSREDTGSRFACLLCCCCLTQDIYPLTLVSELFL